MVKKKKNVRKEKKEKTLSKLEIKGIFFMLVKISTKYLQIISNLMMKNVIFYS